MRLSEVSNQQTNYEPIKLSQVSGIKDGVASGLPNYNNILQNAALSAIKNVAMPFNPLSTSQLNTVATNPGATGDLGVIGGYALGKPVIGGAIGQASGEALKQMEDWYGSGGEQTPDLGSIATQGAWGAWKGVLSKFGVGAATNLIPGGKNFVANKLLDAAQRNRASIGTDYGNALENIESKYNQSGTTANLKDAFDNWSNPNTTATSGQKEVADAVRNEAEKRGINISALSPKDYKNLQDIFNNVSDIWHKTTSNFDRVTTGIGDMDATMTQVRDSVFPEFQGMDKLFQQGIKPFQNLGISSKTDVNSIARMMDKSKAGFSGAVRQANQPGVFGPLGSQVMNDASGFQQSTRLFGNILQRIAQMAGGVGTGFGIGKALGGGNPPPVP